jgi:hypothetical protein
MKCAARARLRSFAAATALVCATAQGQGQAKHACDALGERGWQTVATLETLEQFDNAPRQEGASGEWFVERTITQLPFCNYYNAVGNYSLRSYSLSPVTLKERVTICRRDDQGVSVAVAPYGGRCPPG